MIGFVWTLLVVGSVLVLAAPWIEDRIWPDDDEGPGRKGWW